MASSADVARAVAIIGRLRSTWGVEVLEVPGWQSRGATWARTPIGLVDHHDASTVKSGEWGALGIIRDGRGGADPVPGPLASWQGARCLDGKPRVAIVAAGRGNHAGRGGPMMGIPRDVANGYLYGVEWANDGAGERLTSAAEYAHVALFRSIMDVCGFPLSHIVGHKEWAPGRKFDPVYDMGWRRATVADATPHGAPTPPPAPSGVLRQGSTGTTVRSVQAFLRRVFPSYAGGLVADGVFGPATAAVVREYQRRVGLAADGVIGPATWAALARSGYR